MHTSIDTHKHTYTHVLEYTSMHTPPHTHAVIQKRFYEGRGNSAQIPILSQTFPAKPRLLHAQLLPVPPIPILLATGVPDDQSLISCGEERRFGIESLNLLDPFMLLSFFLAFAQTHTHTRTFIHTRTHIHMHTHSHLHTYTHTHTYTQTHTQKTVARGD